MPLRYKMSVGTFSLPSDGKDQVNLNENLLLILLKILGEVWVKDSRNTDMSHFKSVHWLCTSISLNLNVHQVAKWPTVAPYIHLSASRFSRKEKKKTSLGRVWKNKSYLWCLNRIGLPLVYRIITVVKSIWLTRLKSQVQLEGQRWRQFCLQVWCWDWEKGWFTEEQLGTLTPDNLGIGKKWKTANADCIQLTETKFSAI